MAGLKQHLTTVLVAVVVAALGAGGSIFLLGGNSSPPAAASATTGLHDQKVARHGRVSPLGTPTKPRKVVAVERSASPQRALQTVQASSFYNAAVRIVSSHWGTSALKDAHVSLSVPCKDSYAVVLWSSPDRLSSIEVWLRQSGTAWQALSATYTHYSGSGQTISANSLPGSHKPSSVSCFQ